MKKRNARFALLGFVFLPLVVSGCHPDNAVDSSESSSSYSSSDSQSSDSSVITYKQIELLSPKAGEEFNITPSPIANYLNATTEDEQIAAISEAKKAENKNLTNESVTLSWKKDGSANYTISLGTKEDLSDALEIKVSSLSNTYEAENLIPNTTYYWQVKGTRTKDTSIISNFKTTGSSVRFIHASGAYNIRDLGGWKAGDKQIAYGKIYRGGLLNNFNGYADLDSRGIKTFNDELGVRTEIDLRITGKDDGGQNACYFDASKKYIQCQLGQYNRILDPDSFAKSNGYDDYTSYVLADEVSACNQDGISVKTLRTIFQTLADEENYPIYFHCNAGADRTGTLAFLIEGLLGVDYEDTVRDFELTSFSKFGERLRSALSSDGTSFDDSGVYQNTSSNYIAFGRLYRDLLAYYGDEKGNLSSAIYNYLVGYVGVLPSEIQSLKDILLGASEKEHVVLPSEQEIILEGGSSISLDLSSASLDEGSISSISLADKSLGTDPNNIALASLSSLAGEREFVIKAKKDGEDVVVFAPVLLITKIISTVEEFVALDTYRSKSDGTNWDRIINYGYYRLANDIGTESSPIKNGGWIKEQISVNGSIGFRGTIDGNGKTIYILPQYGGLFSAVGGGAVIKNVHFAVTSFGSTSGGYDSNAVLGVVLCGAILDGVTFSVLKDGWGDNYENGLFVSGGGFISAYVARACLIRNVTINSECPLVSVFGGLYYNGMNGIQFDNLVLNCSRLGYLGVKSTITGRTIDTISIDDCYLPMEFEGISGNYMTSSVTDVSAKLYEGYASISLGGKYGAMKLISASFMGKRIDDAALESNSLIFDGSSFLGTEENVSGTLSMKLQKGDILCTYSLKLKLTK